MFLLLPLHTIILLYLLLAVGPALALLIYVYRQDAIEKEPAGLLWQLALRGVIAGFLSMVLERIGTRLLDMSPLQHNTPVYTAALAFLVVAVIEEGTKYLLMARATWNHPAFNYRFDGIVYAVFTSLGFAAMENILYGLGYGPQVFASRAFLAIPGHMSFAVLFGTFYGKARLASSRGQRAAAVADIVIGYVLAVFLHGLYDTCAMMGTGAYTLLFFVVVVVIYLIIFRLVKKEAQKDQWIP